MTRVMLVDDHVAFREALAFMIGREPDLEVVAEAGSLAETRTRLDAGTTVDVAVVDLLLPDGSGIDLVRDIRRRNANGAVLVLTGSTDERNVAFSIEAGAAGVLHKSAPLSEIIDAIRRLAEGGFLMPVNQIVDLVRRASEERASGLQARQMLARLTPREREVLSALALGLNDRQIADRLSISPETVRTHMVNILAKLEVDSRLAALVFAVRHGAVTIG